LPHWSLFLDPTPLERLDRLSEELCINLYVKRDDVLSLGCGGNKVRKLEYILGKAREDGVTDVITTGGPQSNHARLTAAATARAGMKCHLYLRGEDPSHRRGNLLLDRIFGAEITLLGKITYEEVDKKMAELAVQLRASGRNPLVVPLGGATPEGTLGYFAAFCEILSQCSLHHFVPDLLVVAAGTGSTQAGLVVGAAILAPNVRVLGVSVSWTSEKLVNEVRRHAFGAAELIGRDLRLGTDVIWVDDSYVGPGYSVPTKLGQAALLQVARREGILLDSTYTAKAMSGLLDLIQKGHVAAGASVVFIHTGGTPEIYARAAEEFEGTVT
jgi:D-cysteine desulfhydrase